MGIAEGQGITPSRGNTHLTRACLHLFDEGEGVKKGPTKILIVDDHQVVLGGIKSTLSEHSRFLVVGEARNGREAVRMTQALKPDVVIMDITMPDLNGIDATIQIKKLDGSIRVIIFSMHADKEYVMDLLKADISAYVLKEDPMTELIEAIDETSQGKTFFSKSATQILLSCIHSLGRLKDRDKPLGELSVREREVLQLLAEGHTVKVIGEKLAISPKTVESHKYNIMSKLGVSRAAELTRIAIREKIITP